MGSPFEEDWFDDFDTMVSQEEELMREAAIEAALHEEAYLLGSEPPGCKQPVLDRSPFRSTDVAAAPVSVQVSPTLTYPPKPAPAEVPRQLPFWPKWLPAEAPMQQQASSSSSSSSTWQRPALIETGALEPLARSIGSAPSTPPPSKRQRGIEDSTLSPAKMVPAARRFPVAAQDTPCVKADWTAMPSTDCSGKDGKQVLLPVSQIPLAAASTAHMPVAPSVDASPGQLAKHGAAVQVAQSFVALSSSSGAAQTAVVAEPTAARRRLRTKSGAVAEPTAAAAPAGGNPTDDVEHEAALAVLQLDSAFTAVNWPAANLWMCFSVRMRKKFTWDACRTAWCRARSEQLRQQGAGGRVVALARAAYGSLHGDTRKAVHLAWLAKVPKPAHISIEEAENDPAVNSVLTKPRGSSLLCTWNNSKWLLPPACTKHGLDKGVEVARRIAWVSKLFDTVSGLLDRLLADYRCLQYAVALEICPNSFEQGIGRVHVHAFLKPAAGRAWFPNLKELELDGALPHCVTGMSASRSRSTSGNAGLFYVQAPKRGSIFTHGSKQPFTGYPVSATWILNMLQGGKITPLVAKDLVLRTVSGATRALAEIRLAEEAGQQAAIMRAQDEARRGLQRTRKPWRRIPLVEKWLEQYEELHDRYRFLVLEGPSSVGKTVYARTLAPRSRETLELNCAGNTALDLRSFRREEHGAILFDEISPAQVASQRKLFQACCAKVQLGLSPTGQHVYSVFLHRVRLICCSNDWTRKLQQEPEDVQEWLNANSNFVLVDGPLWQEDSSCS